MTPEMTVMILLVFVMAYAGSRVANRRARRKWGRSPLDSELFRFPDGTPFRVRDMLRSIEVKGITGSGKSSGAAYYFISKLARHPRATMLLIAQKPEEREEYRRIFREAGRELIVVGEGSKAKCNLLDFELKRGGDTRSIVEFLATAVEALEAGTEARGSDPFWKQSQERMLYNAVGAVRLGEGTVGAPALLEFIATAAYSPEALADPKWQAMYHNRVMAKADARPKTRREQNDFDLVLKYWVNEFPGLDDRPRGSIIAGVMNMLHTYNTGLVREVCSEETTASPDDLAKGRSILIDFPFSSYGPSGRLIAGGWKYLVQKDILRRRWDPRGYFTVIVCDEYQESVTAFDARFLAQSRSHGGALLALTQTIHSEYGAVAGHSGHHKVDALLANFGLHVYHTCDAKTAKFASELLGMRKEVSLKLGERESCTLYQQMVSGGRYSISMDTSYQPVLQPIVFMSGLRSGGPENGGIVSAIAIRLGEPFRDGENFQYIEFRQPGR